MIPSTANHHSSSKVRIIIFKIILLKRTSAQSTVVTVSPQFFQLSFFDLHLDMNILKKFLTCNLWDPIFYFRATF